MCDPDEMAEEEATEEEAEEEEGGKEEVEVEEDEEVTAATFPSDEALEAIC